MVETGVGDFEYPAKNWVAFAKSDTDNLDYVSRALFVGTGGDVAAVSADDDVVTFKNVPSGSVLPIRVKRVNSANTTAADFVALY